jgi:peptidoglycan/xylan/chitin deacetylase (PgdA/CDA1 family)
VLVYDPVLMCSLTLVLTALVPRTLLLTRVAAASNLAVSTSLFREAIGDSVNPNNCTIPVTYFTMQGGTDCNLVKERWQAGDEIASHSVTHQPMDTKFPDIEGEIIGQRTWLIEECGIPAEDVVGWRSPYLVNNPKHRQALVKGGYSYDSTINEHWPDLRLPNSEPNTVSPNGANRVWPYTMDYGIPQNCAWTGGLCTPDEKYKGFWEIPVWNIQTDNYPDNAYALDPCDAATKPCDIYALLKDNFDKAYSGNRAPVPLYVHSPWLSQPESMKAVKKFIDYVGTKKDAYFVTMRQLMDWMQDPVGVDQMGPWLGCGVAGGKAAKGAAGATVGIAAIPEVPTVAPVAEVPVAEVPVAAAPIAEVPIAEVPIAETPVAGIVTAQAPAKAIVEQHTTATPAPASSATQRTIISTVFLIGTYAGSTLFI